MSLEGQSIGRYKLEQLLGSGGMGEVYVATDSSIRRQVAIKVIRTSATTYPGSDAAKDAARLFQREMRTIAMLDHPNILPLFDYGEETVGKATINYMVMPYRKEGSLADWLQQRNSDLLPLQEVGRLLTQAAKALNYAHRQQVIHQDVKPSNFLMRSEEDHPNEPDLMLADFGVAKFTSATSSMSHTIRGTPTYMAPEQWEGSPTPASDQYALAVMAYELLAGRPPFQGGMGQMMYQHLNVQPQPPSSFNPRIPKDVDNVLLHALAKKPEERFGSIAAFANAFQQALQSTDAPTVAKTPSVSESKNLTATLAISPQEAIHGANRVLTLPGGRRITVTVPANAQNGQELRLEDGQDLYNGIHDTITITLAIVQPKERQPSFYLQQNEEHTFRSTPMSSGVPPTVPETRFSPALSPSSSPPSTRKSSRGRRTLLIGLVILVILASLGVYAFTRNSGSPNPYPPYTGTSALNDSLRESTITWPQASDNGGSCRFTGGAYLASVTPQANHQACINGVANLKDFAYQVRMSVNEGDSGGIVFHADSSFKKYYYFHVGQNGSYGIFAVDDNNNFRQPLKQGSSSSVNIGLNQSNQIGVVVQGSNIDLYVNLHRVDTVNDNTYISGLIGVGAFSDLGDPTEVVFNDAQVWQL
jgi:serine/threonine protein kinase